MVFELQTQQWIATPLERLFRFFTDPRNLPMISPSSSGARLLSVRMVPLNLPGIEGTERMAGVGSEIDISLRFLPWLPLRRRWTARIVEFEFNHHFRDIQISGPFRRFDHRHEFERLIRNRVDGTMVRDVVQYEIGVGPADALLNLFFVRPALARMFAYRYRAIERVLHP